MKRDYVLYVLILALCIWVSVLSSRKPEAHLNTITEEVTVQGFSTDLTTMYEEHSDEVVTITAGDSLSTGFVYEQNNENVYIITSFHGVSNSENIEVLFGKTYKVSAELLGYDFYTDIAVLKVTTPYNVKTGTLGDSSLLKQGEFVMSVGTPISNDYIGSLELGIISLNRIVVDNYINYNSEQHNYYLDTVSFTSNLKQGYSGSPLYNMGGQVVGISTMSSANIRYALTANETKIVADKIIAGGTLNRNNFGVKVIFVKDLLNYEKSNIGLTIDSIHGLYVEDVKADSIMSNAGITKGDVILKINGIETDDLDSYLQTVYLNDTSFEVTYIRNGVEATASYKAAND